MVAVNVRAVFVAVQEAPRRLKQGGRVINIGSMVADHHAAGAGPLKGTAVPHRRHAANGVEDRGASNMTGQEQIV
jgi:NAD(P)-dependent dehydrogenase (short-subunit alcohol dehydrogenase family)